MPAKKSVQLSGVVVATSAICSIDPDQGILRYRGYDITDLAEYSSYEEVAYLLLEGELPEGDQLDAFREELSNRELPAETEQLIDVSAGDASPMEMLRTAASSLSFAEPDEADVSRESERRKAVHLIAKLPTIIARYDRRRRGLEPVAPDPSLGFSENFLTMVRGEHPTAEEVHAFDVVMILHAEHEMNASTFAARVVAATMSDLHSAVVAAICALKGPLHGAANKAAIEVMESFGSVDNVAEGVRGRLEKKQTLYGIGHPLYRALDPRVPILRGLARQLGEANEDTHLVDLAEAYQREAHEQKGLWANVDLYSGVVYRYLGLADDMFPAVFEMARVAGQAAHVLEQHADNKIIRPSSEYTGPEPRPFPVRAAR